MSRGLSAGKGFILLDDGRETKHNCHYQLRRTGTLDITRDGTFVITIGGYVIRARPGDSFSLDYTAKLDSDNDLTLELKFDIPKHED